MSVRRTVAAALPALLLALPAAALPREDEPRVAFSGNVHPAIGEARDAGPVDPAFPMRRMILVLGRRAGAEAQIGALLAAQHDPASPLYHRWLTPEEFGERFGIGDDELGRVLGWLQENGFAIDEVAKGRGWIDFTGTAAQVENAFGTPIHEFTSGGAIRHANVADPSVPARLSPAIVGIASLHDFPKRSYRAAGAGSPEYSNGGTHCLAPADFARIYDLEPLYAQGIDGTGQKIAIVGRVQIDVADVRNFRSRFGLPVRDPLVLVNGPDPGFWDKGEEQEADLDVQWAGGVAPGAQVTLVVSQSTDATDGVDLSAQYIVEHNLAAVMSTSFGECESDMGTTNLTFYQHLWTQAAVQGITSFVSSGDTGFAGCDGGQDLKPTGAAVNGVASSDHVVAVGGTQFDEGGQTTLYWTDKPDAATGLSAVSYIPEKGWNESQAAGGHGLWASGGGASAFRAKPSWQAGPGVPADGKRDLPDVSLAAATHDGYFVFQGDNGGGATIGGTSAASPAMAGIMALIVQKAGARQGNANRGFYPLASAQSAGSGPAVFHDVVSGDSDLVGLAGGKCGPGFDLVTGLGSVDAFALANAWESLPRETIPPPGPRRIAPVTQPAPRPVDRPRAGP
ncbi:MAG TPA: S53 family peptidase [Thermoanaerobaculia bacterium]|nr:S53 family peptidase [Thermoanaerobaculia bacterium]